MSALFDFDRPGRYAVLGNPISHSKSPRIHALFAEQTGRRIEYVAIQVDLGGFAQAVEHFVATGGKGLNVTVPFKQDAWKLVDERTPRAARAKAVNTIVVQASSRLLGDNTDGVGLVRDLTNNHGLSLAGTRLLLLGAGGAARGVIEPLLQAGVGEIVIVNRTADKAYTLAADFQDAGTIRGGGWNAFGAAPFDIIVNATAASLQGEALALPAHILKPGAFCYDMMYGPIPTAFLTWAQQHGTRRADGLGMLVEQAAEAFRSWHGVHPATQPVIEGLRREMAPPE